MPETKDCLLLTDADQPDLCQNVVPAGSAPASRAVEDGVPQAAVQFP
jgi:hypothetical protein